MKKFWVVFAVPSDIDVSTKKTSVSGVTMTTREAADDEVKRRAAVSMKSDDGYTWCVAEAMSAAKTPVPAIDLVELK